MLNDRPIEVLISVLYYCNTLTTNYRSCTVSFTQTLNTIMVTHMKF